MIYFTAGVWHIILRKGHWKATLAEQTESDSYIKSKLIHTNSRKNASHYQTLIAWTQTLTATMIGTLNSRRRLYSVAWVQGQWIMNDGERKWLEQVDCFYSDSNDGGIDSHFCTASTVAFSSHLVLYLGEKKLYKHPVSILRAWISRLFLSSCGCTQHVLVNEVQELYQGLMWFKKASYLCSPFASESACFIC